MHCWPLLLGTALACLSCSCSITTSDDAATSTCLGGPHAAQIHALLQHKSFKGKTTSKLSSIHEDLEKKQDPQVNDLHHKDASLGDRAVWKRNGWDHYWNSYEKSKSLLQKTQQSSKVAAFRNATQLSESAEVVNLEQVEEKPFYDVLIAIPSHGSAELGRRNAIRESWAGYMTSPQCKPCQRWTVKVLFVVGQEGNPDEMKSEASKFGDLGVLTDFGQMQYYTSRAEKTQRTLRYAMEHFHFRYLLKTDTDAWVFVDNLLTFLDDSHLFTRSANLPGVYAGDFADGKNVVPVQDPTAKWYDGVFTAVTGYSIYPPHAKGVGYLLSPDLVEYIASMGVASDSDGASEKDYSSIRGSDGIHWAHMPQFADLPSEDVSTGFWLEVVNHTKIDMPVSITDNGCTTRRDQHLVVDHYVSPEKMADRWRHYQEAGDACA